MNYETLIEQHNTMLVDTMCDTFTEEAIKCFSHTSAFLQKNDLPVNLREDLLHDLFYWLELETDGYLKTHDQFVLTPEVLPSFKELVMQIQQDLIPVVHVTSFFGFLNNQKDISIEQYVQAAKSLPFWFQLTHSPWVNSVGHPLLLKMWFAHTQNLTMQEQNVLLTFLNDSYAESNNVYFHGEPGEVEKVFGKKMSFMVEKTLSVCRVS